MRHMNVNFKPLLHYLWLADLSKSFFVNIYLFSIFFSIDFTRWENVGLPPHCLYRDSLTLNKVDLILLMGNTFAETHSNY